MARSRYAFVIWQDKPRWYSAESMSQREFDGGEAWFDLDDELGTLESIAERIRMRNRDEDGIGRYRLELLDPDTREHIRTITPSYPDLVAAREAGKVNPQAVGAERSIANFSDEQILTELRRRLRAR